MRDGVKRVLLNVKHLSQIRYLYYELIIATRLAIKYNLKTNCIENNPHYLCTQIPSSACVCMLYVIDYVNLY